MTVRRRSFILLLDLSRTGRFKTVPGRLRKDEDVQRQSDTADESCVQNQFTSPSRSETPWSRARRMAAMPGEYAASVGVRRPPLRTPTGLARSGRRRTVASNPTKNQPTLSRTAEMSAVDIATGVRDAAARRASSNVRKTTWRQAIRPGNRAATRRLGPGLTCALPTSGIDPHPRRPTHRAPAAVIPGTGHRAERTCPR